MLELFAFSIPLPKMMRKANLQDPFVIGSLPKETKMSGTQLPQFNAQDLLDQILGAGKKLASDSKEQTSELTDKAKNIALRGEDALIDKLGIEDTAATRDALRKGAGTAGALALLLSSRSARKVATLGGLAGLGVLAYRAHKAGKMPESVDDVIGLIKGPSADKRADHLLQAMVAAAKADGKLSKDEVEIIMALNPESVDKLEAALTEEPDAKAIAALASNDQEAAEIYAVSCRVANGLNVKERDYLDHLAMALRLDPVIAAKLETDVRTG